MRIGHSGSGVKRIGHDSKVGCVLMTDRKDFIPMDKSAFSQKLVNYGSAWQMDGRKYDGTDDAVDCGNDASVNITGAITIEAWINSRDVTVSKGIVRKGISNTDIGGFELLFGSGGNLSFIIFNTTWETKYQIVDPVISNNNTWYYVVVTVDGSVGKLYRNGILKTSLNQTIALNSDSGNLIIGDSVIAASYKGSINKVRIQNIAQYMAKITTGYFRRKAGIGG